ncbi:hypothetical protein OG417_34360 [Actinoallomurus sp. NBC_01490]|uniref:hypothetical protein n=1 Tax=Actinoallomurus sp. NBC_01490 TaxID=2903557 RepID=UPI002E302074|nr:hypothetical protein [Actinoallomurus sp. NBC_01490]
MEKNHAQRHHAAMMRLIDLYSTIEEWSSRLPLRIEVPLLHGEELYRAEVWSGLTRAFTILADLPMDREARQVLRKVIGDWLIAMDLLFRDEEDEAAWHLDIVRTQLQRITSAIQAKAALFAGPTGHS